MHQWGDEDVDWEGIDRASEYIGEGLRRWRADVRQYKEKYGTVRVYCTLGLTSLHQLTHPGYVYRQWKSDWWWNFDCMSPVAKFVVRALNVVFVPFHKWLYRRYYRLAIARWPHLQEEILCAADYDELLGGL